MKKRTCKFGWTDDMTQLVINGKEIARRDLATGASLVERAKQLHAQRVEQLKDWRFRRRCGVRPLSRMHPDHPVRKNALVLEAPAGQEFVP